MYEVTFLECKGDNPDSTKSSDAVCIWFDIPEENRNAIVVIDGGYADVGNELVNHIQDYYGTNKVDLMISTHPDMDHINGLVTAIQQLEVAELFVHMPELHFGDLAEKISNYDSIGELQAFAQEQGTIITEPEVGLERFGGRIRILAPTVELYRELMASHIAERIQGTTNASRVLNPLEQFMRGAAEVVDRILSELPIETLGHNNSTTAKNETSVVTLLEVDGKRLLFTGDSGPRGLEMASNVYDYYHGSFEAKPLRLFQVPHHGSRKNMNVATINRILGAPGSHHSDSTTAVISAAKASKKHPSPKVTNALIRRGVDRSRRIATTEGGRIVSRHNVAQRPGMGPVPEYPIRGEE